MSTLRFKRWRDGSPDNPRTINTLDPQSFIATYVEVIQVANVVFSGKVTPVSVGPRIVTIVVTMPDSTQDTLPTVQTDAQGNFTTTKQYPAGSYSAVASVPEDAQNEAGSSPVTSFQVPKSATTVTLEVNLA